MRSYETLFTSTKPILWSWQSEIIRTTIGSSLEFHSILHSALVKEDNQRGGILSQQSISGSQQSLSNSVRFIGRSVGWFHQIFLRDFNQRCWKSSFIPNIRQKRSLLLFNDAPVCWRVFLLCAHNKLLIAKARFKDRTGVKRSITAQTLNTLVYNLENGLRLVNITILDFSRDLSSVNNLL